jgi:hypothetical protein
MTQQRRRTTMTGVYLDIFIESYYSMGRAKIAGKITREVSREMARILGIGCVFIDPNPRL